MPMLRELAPPSRFPYLATIGLDPADAGRLDVVEPGSDVDGVLVDPATGDIAVREPGEPVPPGVWVAQADIDDMLGGPGTRRETHGFGEGFGAQGEQIGGDRSYAEDDSGGTLRGPGQQEELDEADAT
ncbi:MAG TPA: hypothetical protein VFU81_04835 [Thermomicrobiales bacterium]|nr:hypothetical protein [Thermomicrobiales bacterium]